VNKNYPTEKERKEKEERRRPRIEEVHNKLLLRKGIKILKALMK